MSVIALLHDYLTRLAPGHGDDITLTPGQVSVELLVAPIPLEAVQDVLLEVVGAAEAELLADLGVNHPASTASLVKDPETPTNWNQEQ